MKTLRYQSPLIVCILLILILLKLPTGFEGAVTYQEAERCVATVTSVDNSSIVDTGLVRSGEQRCVLKIEDGKFKDQTVTGVNMLRGSLEQDKLFSEGDRALVVVSYQGETVSNVTMIDHYRIPGELVMAGMFVLFLIFFAGRTGVRAVFSFILTIVAIWKLLTPMYLKGWNPIWAGLAVLMLLTIIIIAMVYGFDRRCASAVSGAFLGILVTCVLGILFTDMFKIHGAVMSYSESLLYSGYQDLNLTQIFMASIFLGSSGAVMDLAVDITSAVYEVVEKRPDISRREAVRSGMNVGRAAMGTMTTTLLLAYSGGYIALLMVFMAQGTPLPHLFNYKYVAAELIHTVIGSFGLVLVAPFTALCAGVLLAGRKGADVSLPQSVE
ncbi:YibE/F family protein [Frisingicoccus sp.]|uniref:YibE/F family protein n=1 Tax=Frisingicoccus sp. TaxID=1918627 RepID=UPI00386FBFE7